MMAGQADVGVRLLWPTRTERMAPVFQAMATAPVRFSGAWLAASGLPAPALRAENAAIFRIEAA